MVESKFDPEWSDDSEEEERKARGEGSGFGAIRSATFIENQTKQGNYGVSIFYIEEIWTANTSQNMH